MKTFNQYLVESANKNNCLVLTNLLQEMMSLFKTLHWNVNGEGTLELHELFGEIYEQLQPFQDRVAEKARTMGVYVSLEDRGATEVQQDFVPIAVVGLTKLRSALETFRSQDLTSENILGELSELVDGWLYKLSIIEK